MSNSNKKTPFLGNSGNNGKGPNNNKQRVSNIAALGIALAAFFALNHYSKKDEEKPEEVTWTHFQQHVDAGHITDVSVIENGGSNLQTYYSKISIDGENTIDLPVPANDEAKKAQEELLKNQKGAEGRKHKSHSKKIYTSGPADAYKDLEEQGVSIHFEKYVPKENVLGMLVSLSILGLLVYVMFKMMKGPGTGMGQNKKQLGTSRSTKTFADVAGVDESKQEVSEVVDFLKNPEKFARVGAKSPKGVILVGPPGTGKTLLARAVAGEAGVPFFSVSGSEFVEMYVGRGAARVRDLFQRAKKNAPCIIFIDEIDAVAQSRNGPGGGGHDERQQTLNQLLVEMDGFSDTSGIVIMGATNQPEKLDKAILRPGRFDRQVMVGLPDIKGREAILKIHTKNKPLAADIDLKRIARNTPGFSGADLEGLANEAAIFAARDNRTEITYEDFLQARDKVWMGPERKSTILTDEDKKMIAYHEAGHTMINLHEDDSAPLEKVTIIPRGMSLGAMFSQPREGVSYKRKQMLADLRVALGGRIAEEMIFGKDDVSSGASNDIQQATDLAIKMVAQWGLSDELGTIDYSGGQSSSFLGGGATGFNKIASGAPAEVKQEIQKLVKEAYEYATNIMEANKDNLKKLAEALLERESLSSEEVYDLIKIKKIDKTKSNKSKLKPE